MSEYQKILPIANQILQKHELCDNCLGRLFSKKLHLSSNKLLGKKLKKNHRSTQKCYICKNIFDNLDYFLKMMIDTSSNYSFKSFSIGTTLKPSIIDRDDNLRSNFKLKGIDGIKTDITKELGKLFSKKTKHFVTNRDPEVSFTVNLKDESCIIRSRPIVLSGRYTKNSRDIPQRQKPCDNCSGKGCRICDFHGISEFDSVEGILSRYIFEKLGGTTAKFTWIGGEDKSSLVLGSGRPFFVKLQNPNKRNFRKTTKSFDSLKISELKLIDDSPKKPVKFTSSIKVKISSKSEIDSKMLKNLKILRNNFVRVNEPSGKSSEKKIFSESHKKITKNSFSLSIKAEGGLPIKRFVNGDDVLPNISKLLGISCICKEFDFLDVKV